MVEFKPVDETTPQFRNFYIKNVVCLGADKALFVRGLPEMSIHDISLENITVTSEKGIDISEAKNISLKNFKVIDKNDGPAIDVLNSSNISFTNVSAPDDSTLLRIGGDRSSAIKWKSNTEKDIKKKTTFEFGAAESALISE